MEKEAVKENEIEIINEPNPEDLAPVKEEVKKKQNKQVLWAIIFMIIIIIVAFAIPVSYNYFFNKFNYIGLKFEKTKMGEIIFYSTKIPITKYAPVSGQAISSNQIAGYYPINFRSDPRGLKNIMANLNPDEIAFIKKNTVYISLDPEMNKCSDNTLALVNFAGFLKDFANLKIKSAVSNKNYSEETNTTYATCENYPTNTLINIKSGNETRIDRIKDKCYQLTYKECDIIAVTEKFEVMILEGYMNYFNGNFKEENLEVDSNISLSLSNLK